jgi:putative oxygen-independent coproporphyrinogen III oxidase
MPMGEPVPQDGHLPDEVLSQVGRQPFGAYVHVPFCASRCGYCDFNTYAPNELDGATTDSYVESALAEMAFARAVIGEVPALRTVFFGGGTPTMLPAQDMVRMLHALRDNFGLQPEAEVTTEANPESVDPVSLELLREAGFNRISFGMQSAVPHVLSTLDRVHTAGRVSEAVAEARKAGFTNLSVDLIYGTPGESLSDWRTSLETAIALEPDHISAYALIVEPGTRLATQVRHGDLAAPDPDDQATKYEMGDDLLAAAGFDWYEVSNWARGTNQASRHNMSYWLSHDWWGFGPGAHSHIAGLRWWNVKHPRAYSERLSAGHSPAFGRELLDEQTRELERVLLQTRLHQGLSVAGLAPNAVANGQAMTSDGLLDPDAWCGGRVVLTRQGRLLADLVVRQLTDG